MFFFEAFEKNDIRRKYKKISDNGIEIDRNPIYTKFNNVKYRHQYNHPNQPYHDSSNLNSKSTETHSYGDHDLTPIYENESMETDDWKHALSFRSPKNKIDPLNVRSISATRSKYVNYHNSPPQKKKYSRSEQDKFSPQKMDEQNNVVEHGGGRKIHNKFIDNNGGGIRVSETRFKDGIIGQGYEETNSRHTNHKFFSQLSGGKLVKETQDRYTSTQQPNERSCRILLEKKVHSPSPP